MNPYSYNLLILLSAVLLFASSACCPNCDKGFVGDFGLESSTSEWFLFANEPTRIFENQDNEQIILSYKNQESDFRSSADGCEEQGNCGLCCYSFNIGYYFVELSSPDASMAFQLLIEKNLITHSPTDPVSEIDDLMTIGVGNQFESTLFGLPDTVLPQSVSLNGKGFSRVFSHEDDISEYPASTPANTPISFFFTKAQGIVGFKTFGGDIWALKL
ncbi:MAG: hypothetical protein AAF587_42910 [Bacteroidota bacterium]